MPQERKAARSQAGRIIDVFLSSETMADIVLLFRSNLTLITSARHIALLVGESPESITNDLQRLVELGILRSEKSGEQIWFAYDEEKDKKIQKIVETYIRNRSCDRHGSRCDGQR